MVLHLCPWGIKRRLMKSKRLAYTNNGVAYVSFLSNPVPKNDSN